MVLSCTQGCLFLQNMEGSESLGEKLCRIAMQRSLIQPKLKIFRFPHLLFDHFGFTF